MKTQLRVLIVEDSESDARLIVRQLQRAGYDLGYERVETAEAMKTALVKQDWDLVIADYNLPRFSGPAALETLKERALDIPFILVSATMGEENAVAMMKSGAHDYIMKDNLSRLVPAVERELREAAGRLERRRADEALQKERSQAQEYLDIAGVALVALDATGRITLINKKGCEILGYEEQEILGQNWFEVCLPSAVGREVKMVFQQLMSGDIEPVEYYENQVLTKTGEQRILAFHNTVIRDQFSQIIGILFSGEDITERKRAEETLLLDEARLEALVNLSQMSGTSLRELAHFALEEGVRLTKSTIGYLAFMNEDETVLTMHAWSRQAMDQCAIYDKPIEYPLVTTGQWGEAVRQRRPVIINDFAAPRPDKKGYPPGHVEVLRHMNLPVFDGQRIVAVAGVGNKEEPYNASDVRQLSLLMDGMWNLVQRSQAETALKESLSQLHRTLDSTAMALATTVEMRDPYTAGHQKRVALLVCAIGQEMGFSADQLEGMRVMGMLHDIGKIAVPAEILSRPGKISEMEFNIVKGHSQVGYDITKDIEFPWPVARGILQHHERLDGSGYPHRIKGDEITLEGKIMAVADVVEAMASHRPYRPALGIEMALEEITKNKGILYDPEVVDICVRLLTEKGFKFD